MDTGADRTVLDRRTAEAIGFDARRATPGTLVAGKTKYDGASFPVDIQVGRRRALVDVFVPADCRFDERIIGHDFLQASGARLDFGKEHRSVFGGSAMREPSGAGSRVLPTKSARQAARIRARMVRTCPAPKKRRR